LALPETQDEIVTFLTSVEEKTEPLHPIHNGSAKDLQLRMFGFTPEEKAWRVDALCQGMGESSFFPERGYSMLPAYVICHSCPVRVECLESAITNDDDHGIRGGFTPYERDKIKVELSMGISIKDAMEPKDRNRELKLKKARTRLS
jgi:WhiB family redox-sensing transcriptional regulator